MTTEIAQIIRVGVTCFALAFVLAFLAAFLAVVIS